MTCAEEYPYGHILTFNGSVVGTRIVGYQVTTKRITPVSVRHNFWASRGLMDGRYPALLWEHTFLIFDERDTVTDYTNAVHSLSRELVTSNPQPLLIKSEGASLTIFNLGNCYIEGGGHSDPSDLLLFQAGIYNAKFISVTTPTTV